MSGGTKVTIRGVGFKDKNIKVVFSFTAGDSPITPNSTIEVLEVGGVYVSETELTCVTPNFEKFGACKATVKVTISGGYLTTTFVPFSYTLNTRACMSLCYGPGI